MVEDSPGEELAPSLTCPAEQEQCRPLGPTQWPLAAAGSPLDSVFSHRADAGAPPDLASQVSTKPLQSRAAKQPETGCQELNPSLC